MTKGELVLASRVRDASVPRAEKGRTLVLATWNVRELGQGRRRDDSIRMIARIVSSFSMVSLVELGPDTRELDRILAALGPRWRALFSDPLEDPASKAERACFLFDSRHVEHTGLATVEPTHRKSAGAELPAPHWWRRPYVAEFRCGSFVFLLSTAHVRWNAAKGGRLSELHALGEWAHRRIACRPSCNALVLAGDTDVRDASSSLCRALTGRGLALPGPLLGTHGTKLAGDKRYDQLVCLPRDRGAFTGRGGVVDFYRDDLEALYPRLDEGKSNLTRQLSDHLPLWAELAVG